MRYGEGRGKEEGMKANWQGGGVKGGREGRQVSGNGREREGREGGI